ncbi:MAG: RsmG family class I SAM-dependent methyltransferase [Candidatus Krumholzibacteriia bacterium]
MTAEAGDPLAIYRRELLRWNARTNLVSREDPERQVSVLLEQSTAAWGALAAGLGELAPAAAEDVARGSFGYVDIGSGGGFPGIPWLLSAMRPRPDVSCLVEPRARRAWFLERVLLLTGRKDTGVLAARWGAEPLPIDPAAAPGTWILSLMALRLTDPQVLSGWRRSAPDSGAGTAPRIVIARIRPATPGGAIPPALRQELALPGDEQCRLLPCGAADSGASLLLSLYEGPPAGW